MVRKSIGLGVVLSFSATTASTTFTTLAGVRDADGPAGSGDDVDTSTLDNATNFKTFLRGQVDAGELTLNLAHSSTDPSQKQLITLYNAGTVHKFKTALPSTAEPPETFAGYIKNVSRTGMAADGFIMRAVTFKLSGPPNFTST